MESSLKHLSMAVQVALETGDMQFAGLIAHAYCFIMFDTGKPLDELKTKMLMISTKMRRLKQAFAVNMSLPLMDMIQAFMDESEGDDGRNQVCHFESDHVYPESWIHQQRCIVNYVFGNFETSLAEGDKAGKSGYHPYESVDIGIGILFHGLACLAVCRSPLHNRRKLIAKAKRYIILLEKISRGAPEYCLGKVFLLKAELSVVHEKFDDARSHYISAIAISSKGGLLLEEAIANERAGRLMYALEDNRAAIFFNEAISVFQKWGAKAKSKRLRDELQMH